MTNHSGLPRTFPILNLKAPHPRKSFIPGQTRIVGHPKLKTKFREGNGVKFRVGMRIWIGMRVGLKVAWG